MQIGGLSLLCLGRVKRCVLTLVVFIGGFCGGVLGLFNICLVVYLLLSFMLKRHSGTYLCIIDQFHHPLFI